MSRFRLGETYITKCGYPARIICVDSPCKTIVSLCPIVALITVPATVSPAGVMVYHYSENGKMSGTGNASYDLISDEPTEEEAQIISEIRDLMEGKGSDDVAFTRVLRKLRNK